MNNNISVMPYTSLTGLAKSASISPPKQDAKLAEACREFESVFLTTLWRNMAKNAGMDLGPWDVLFSQSMGKVWAQGGGIGLAKVLYDQLSKSSPSDLSGDDADGQEPRLQG